MATCCFPSDRKLIGFAKIAPPAGNRQRGLPVAASSAKNNPSLDPPNTTPPAVAKRPDHGGERSLNSQTLRPVGASSALIDPTGSTPGIPAIPPPGYQLPGS